MAQTAGMGRVGPQSWGAGAGPWGGQRGHPCSLMGWEASAHFGFPAPLKVSNTTGAAPGHGSTLPQGSAGKQRAGLALLLIPVPDRALA